MEEISSITWDTGCIFPFGLSRAGKVTSTLFFCSFWFISIFSNSLNLPLIASLIFCFSLLREEALTFFWSSDKDPSFFELLIDLTVFS